MWNLDRFSDKEDIRRLREEILALTQREEGRIDPLLVNRRGRELRDAYVGAAVLPALKRLRYRISAFVHRGSSADHAAGPAVAVSPPSHQAN